MRAEQTSEEKYGSDLIEHYLQEHRTNKDRYLLLSKLCSECIENPSSFRTTPFSFPILPTKPNSFPPSGELILQQATVRFFVRLYEAWVKGTEVMDKHGWFFTGPKGTGKSFALYSLVCMARASGFLVLYIPNSDIWSSLPETESNLWLLKEITSGLIDFLDTPTKRMIHKGTWGELLVKVWSFRGDINKLRQGICDLMGELEEHTANPVVYCFDEIGALYRTTIWTNSKACQSPSFSFGCKTTVTPFRRGFKILCDSGYAPFLLHADPGTVTGRVITFDPWSREDFELLLQRVSHPYIKNALEDEKQREMVVSYIIEAVGTVPQELVELLNVLPQIEIKERDPVRAIVNDILPYYEKYRIPFYGVTAANYIDSDLQKDFTCNSILDSFLGSEALISIKFLDLSLMYQTRTICKPINSIASRGISIYLSRNHKLESHRSYESLARSHLECDFTLKDFQKVIAMKIILNSPTVETTLLDHSKASPVVLNCHHSYPFEKSIPNTKVNFPTLFIPSKPLPTADLILISREKVILILITLGEVNSKVPNMLTKNVYNAVFDEEIFAQLRKKDKGFQFLEGKNIVECLLKLTDHSDVEVLYNDESGLLVDGLGNALSCFEYVVITSREWNKGWEEARRFPWVRVISRENLGSILPQALVNGLPNGNDQGYN